MGDLGTMTSPLQYHRFQMGDLGTMTSPLQYHRFQMGDLGTMTSPLQYHMSDQSYLPLLGNICCVIFFLLSLVHPLHTQLEVSVSRSVQLQKNNRGR